MAGKSLQECLKTYRNRIEISMQWRKDAGYDDLWYRLGDLYAGKHFEKGLSKEDQIAVNVAFATVNVIYPTVSVNRPNTTVLARDSDQQDRAVIAEAVVNAWWDAYDILPEFRLAVKDLLICGHGWMKVGYRFNEKEVDRSEDEIYQDFEKARREADQFAAEQVELADQLPTDDEIMASIPSTKMVVDEDHPFAERVSPHDVYVDPEATTMMSIGWIAQRVVRPIDEVRKDKRYDSAARKRITPDRSMNGNWLGPNKKRSDYGDDIQRTTIWEFYDLKAGTISVFAHAGDGFLVKPTKIPYMNGHPFEMLRNYDVPDMFYPMGDLEGIEPLQHELNKTRSQLMNARKQYIRKYLYREDAFDAKGRAALESDKDGVMVPVNGNVQDFSQAVAPLQTHTIPPEIYNYSQIVESDINNVTGVSEYQRGAAPSMRRTATEAAIIQDSVNARSAEKLAIVERAIARVSKRLIELGRQYLTQEGVVRIVGQGGRPVFVPYEPDDLDADLDFEVEAGSTVPKGEDYRRNQAMNLLTVMQPFIGTVLDPHKVAIWALEQFGVKAPQKFIMQQDPMMMMQQMMGGAPGGPPGGPPAGEEGPGPDNNPMAQDPALAAAMGAMNPQAAEAQVPGAISQLQQQVGLNLQ